MDEPGPEPQAPDPLRGPVLRVFASRDILRVAAVARVLDKPAVILSDGAIGWHLFQAMIRAAEAGDTPLQFVFDAGPSAGIAAEALRAGASYVLSTAEPQQLASLKALAQVTGALVLDRLDEDALDCPDVEALKRLLACGRAGDHGGL